MFVLGFERGVGGDQLWFAFNVGGCFNGLGSHFTSFFWYGLNFGKVGEYNQGAWVRGDCASFFKIAWAILFIMWVAVPTFTPLNFLAGFAYMWSANAYTRFTTFRFLTTERTTYVAISSLDKTPSRGAVA